MPTRPTSPRSRKEATDVERLYRYNGTRKISFYYQHPSGKSEPLASAPADDHPAIRAAENLARHKAREINGGVTAPGTVAALIERFATEVVPNYYRDQSRDGSYARNGQLRNLKAFFGRMDPKAMKPLHGYQYLDARAAVGAPVIAGKELSLMSTICHFAVRWGVIESNPFLRLKRLKTDAHVRYISRHQIVRFYLWTQKQGGTKALMGCAAMFCYLTGFRAAEIRPLLRSSITKSGLRIVSAKRKHGEQEHYKVRAWSRKLQTVVARALQHRGDSLYLFPTKGGACYTHSGFWASWWPAMLAWLKSMGPGATRETLVKHPMYFALSDGRPAAISTKLQNRCADAYDFAAHASPSTTHRYYDRRREAHARPTE